MPSPTLKDVAERAGVSYATADRVVNNRGKVAEKSVRKVQDAVSHLGYVRNVAAANLSKRRQYRFDFLLPRGTNAFFARIRAHLDRIAPHLRRDQTTVAVREFDAFDGGSLAKALTTLAKDGTDGAVVVGLSSSRLSEPLSRLRAQNIPIVSLVSDLPHDARAAYVGIDNHAAGRTAARLIGLAHGSQAGRVLTLAGSLDAPDHRDRFDGFSCLMRTAYPEIEVLPPALTADAADTVERIVTDRSHGVTAIYNVGAGNSGLVKALRAHPKALKASVVHELTGTSRSALASGHIDIVIDQGPEAEVDQALTILRNLSDQRPPPPLADLVPRIYVSENLPSDPTQKDVP